ncbi:MAG TPA: SOS response-associated peptidase [Oceanipulchritudo sp.]|nr:SOS response-associated peptidase [Oceanipulchritudo sp.]
MCGRYTLISASEKLIRTFKAEFDKELVRSWKPRYNIAPGSGILAILEDRDRGGRRAEILHWGLVPAWANDPDMGYKLINARAETLSEKPSFKDAFRYRRCLIPASGFYEWERAVSPRQPYYFFPARARPIALAGIWEHWLHPTGSEILSVAIITTAANGPVGRIHDRMPVIMGESDWDRWLDVENERATGLRPLLVAPREDFLEARRVGTRVNKTDLDEPSLIEEGEADPEPWRQLDLYEE